MNPDPEMVCYLLVDKKRSILNIVFEVLG